MKLIYGLHDPRYVSDEQVLHYANRIGLDGDIYRMEEYSESTRKKYNYLGNTMPEVLIFNSKGQLTSFELNCSSRLDSIVTLKIASIDQMATKGNDLNNLLYDTYPLLTKTNLDTTIIEQPLYVVKFAEFAGKLNKEILPGLIQHLKSRTDVKYILLNQDYTISEK